MYRLCNNREVELAKNSLQSLKIAVGNTTVGSVGSEARRGIDILSKQVNAASASIDVLRQDKWTPEACSIVQQYDLLERQAHSLVESLSQNASYSGLRRGQMSIQEKAAFVRENDSEAFLKLPL
jgi:hypothetical protein